MRHNSQFHLATCTTGFPLPAAMQGLLKYVTAPKQLWYRVQGRTKGREHLLRLVALKLWNQLGVLQEVIILYA